MPGRALSDLKVVELASFVSGPWCGKLMADLGAEVIKVEPPEVGDEARRAGPFPGDVPHPEKSALFLYLNTNKLGVTLDVSKATGTSIFKELVKGADILIENNPPRQMEAWGLTYDVLREVNPGLIMTSITPFGQTGPYRDYKGSDLVCLHAGGVGYETPATFVTNPERERPLRGPGRQADLLAGWAGASNTMFAFYHRKVTGEGQHIDISEQEAVADMIRPNVARYSHNYTLVPRLKVAGSWIRPCRNGWVSLSVTQQEHWLAAKKVMGSPEWSEDERFSTIAGRIEHGVELDDLITVWAMEHDMEEIYQEMQKNRVPSMPVYTTEEVLDNHHYKDRKFFVEVEHPVAGKFLYPGAPAKYSASPWSIERPAPTLGEHNEEVLCRRLGYSKEDLARLRGAGVV